MPLAFGPNGLEYLNPAQSMLYIDNYHACLLYVQRIIFVTNFSTFHLSLAIMSVLSLLSHVKPIISDIVIPLSWCRAIKCYFSWSYLSIIFSNIPVVTTYSLPHSYEMPNKCELSLPEGVNRVSMWVNLSGDIIITLFIYPGHSHASSIEQHLRSLLIISH